jgi:hypothetical protein
MRLTVAPEPLLFGDVFLAGGISGCPDWQSRAIEMFSNTDLRVVSPRREEGILSDNAEAINQIAWEFHALQNVVVTMFWFPKETLCPITLFELGAAISNPYRKVVVATHPEYQRRFDVIQQVSHYRPEVNVYDSLEVAVVKTKMILGVI